MPGAARTNASPRRASSRPEQCRGRRRRPSAVEGCRICGRNSATPLPRRPPLEPGIYPARPTRHGTPPLLSIPIRSIRKATIRLLSPSAPDKGRIQLLETLIISFKFIGYQKSSDPLNPYARFMLAPISTVETGGDESGVQLAIWLSCSA
ncbi:hypothetical protein EJB05_01055, partial [Eragrostis curvula]